MEQCNCEQQNGLDIKTPRNLKLSAFYKRSFAHHTVKNRMPIIVTQTIDGLVRNKAEIFEKFGVKGLEELKHIIGKLSKLKYEIQTNKPIHEMQSSALDISIYNKYLKDQLDQNAMCTFFSAIWLHAECYMYRMMRYILEETISFKNFDLFQDLKEKTFYNSEPLFIQLAENLLGMLNAEDGKRDDHEDFKVLLKLNLWGNRCDLSLSNGVLHESNTSMLEMVDHLDRNILCDQSEEVWTAANVENRFQTIDIILDNVGYELFSDLSLADFIITKGLAQIVRFYVKVIPWFISDVTKPDFIWMLTQLKLLENASLQQLGNRWSDYLENGIWTIEETYFWTTPVEYKDMFNIDEDLYRKLARAKLVIFKGDLNYRKLFGERNWEPTTPMETALEGFHPTRVCTIRTLKADMVCGLPEGVAEEMDLKDSEWMVSGHFGVIQYCGKIVRLL